MDYDLLYRLFKNQQLTDLELILDDDFNKITMVVHKMVLVMHSPFFEKMFIFDGKVNSVNVKVDDTGVAKDLILSFYGQKSNTNNYPRWRHELALAKARDYFGIEPVAIEVPEHLTEDSYDYFLELCEMVGFDEDSFKVLTNNLPLEYNLKKLSRELIAKMMESGTVHIISALEKNTYKIYNLFTGELIYSIKLDEKIDSIDFFFRNTNFFVTTNTSESNIRLTKNGEIFYKISGNVADIRFLSDKSHCIVVYKDGLIKKFDLVHKVFTLIFEKDSNNITVSAVSFCEKFLVTANHDGLVKIWDMIKGCYLMDLKGNTKGIKEISFSQDFSFIATVDVDNRMRGWKIQFDPLSNIAYGEILGVSFQGNMYLDMSNEIYIGLRVGNGLKITNVKDDSRINFFVSVTSDAKILFSPDSKFIVIERDNFLYLYVCSTCNYLQTFKKAPASFSSDSKYFVLKQQKSLEIFDLINNIHCEHNEGYNTIIRTMYILPKKNIIVYDTYTNETYHIKVYDMDKRSVINTFEQQLHFTKISEMYNDNAQRLLEIIE